MPKFSIERLSKMLILNIYTKYVELLVDICAPIEYTTLSATTTS